MNEWHVRTERLRTGARGTGGKKAEGSLFMGMPFPSSESLPGGAFPGQLPPALITVAHLSGAL